MAVENKLAHYRQTRGFSAAELAKKIAVSRQTIYAMETGTYVPNTIVALKLAQTLEVKVEDLFYFEPSELSPTVMTAELMPSDQDPQSGLPVQLCEVNSRLVAMLPTPIEWGLPPADAVLLDAGKRSGKAKVQFFNEDKMFQKRIMIAGCDPGIPVLTRHLQRCGVEAVVAYRNSTQSLGQIGRASCRERV